MLKEKKYFVFSSKGSLTVQFLLGFVLTLSFMVIFGAVTLTLAIASITQYITYASSRYLFLSKLEESEQKETAKEKWRDLKNKLVRSDGLIDISQVSLDRDEYLNIEFDSDPSKPRLFYGVWTKLLPKVLMVKTLWGSTTDQELSYFETVVGSYLGREPSIKECEKFNEERWEFIKRIHGPNTGSASSYKASYDNGC